MCGEIYEYLELEPAPQEHREDGWQVTEQYGFRTHMMRIGTTMLEVVSPIRERHELQKFFVEQGGDGGFMVVMQTYDDDALLARANNADWCRGSRFPTSLASTSCSSTTRRSALGSSTTCTRPRTTGGAIP